MVESTGDILPPTYSSPPAKLKEPVLRRLSVKADLDTLFFIGSSLAVLLLAVVLLRQGLRVSWSLLYLLGFWIVLTYLALPRVHRILSAIYVPRYFMGRTHTSDGLLGDPINLACRGTSGQVHEAMTRAGWVRADPITVRTAWRMVYSSLGRRSYPAAPVSPLLLFDRVQEVAYQQEVRNNPSQRHHVRFWPAPEGWLLPGGERVDFLGAGTYDRSVGLSLFTLQVTHKIDADIDAERDYILATVQHASPEVTTTMLKDFSTGYHSRNGGGDEVHTDGNLPILELGALPDTPVPGVPAKASSDLRTHPPAVAAGVILVWVGMLIDALTFSRSLNASLDTVQDLVGEARPAVVAVVVIVAAAFYAGMMLLVWLTARGWAWPRLLLLAALTTQVLVDLAQWVGLPAGALPTSGLIATGAYVLAAYALSSTDARAFSTRHERVTRKESGRRRARTRG